MDDEDEQQQGQQEEIDGDETTATTAQKEDENPADDFDALAFAELLQTPLVAYQCTWDPLTRALETLAAAFKRQQQAQRSDRDELRDELAALRDRVTESEQEKQGMADAMTALRDTMDGLQTKLDEIQHQQQQQQQQNDQQEQKKPNDEASEDAETAQTPQPSLSPYATTNDLSALKRALTEQLKKSLSAIFGEQAIVTDDEDNTNRGSEENGKGSDDENNASPSNANGNESDMMSEDGATSEAQNHSLVAQADAAPVFTGVSGLLRTPLPDVPFASEVKVSAELAKLRELLAAMEDKLNATLGERMDKLREEVHSRGSDSQQQQQQEHQDEREQNKLQVSDPALDDSSSLPLSSTESQELNEKRQEDRQPAERDEIMESLQKQVDTLQAQQNAHQSGLDAQRRVGEQHAARLKELAATLDDLNVQLQMMMGMSQATPRQSEEGTTRSAIEEATPGDDSSETQAGEHTAGGEAVSASANANAGSTSSSPLAPQLDLSLVFTKIADLRRSTDAALERVNQELASAKDACTTQQTAMEAMQDGARWHEMHRLHILDTRLGLQKDMLEKQQAAHEHSKPLIAEWKKAMDTMEDKLCQGRCDHELMDELTLLQRQYHRTAFSLPSLVQASRGVIDALATMEDEIHELQGGLKSGMVLVSNGGDGGTGTAVGGEGGGGSDSARNRASPFARKLRYLDEELRATQTVASTTEKRHEPLLKAMDGVREKLENMSSLWHQNLIQKKAHAGLSGNSDATAGSGAGGDGTGSSSSVADTSGALAGSSSPTDALRELELRVMGAVRRLNAVEDDVGRLSASAVEPNVSDARARQTPRSGSASSSSTTATTKALADELSKFRAEARDEMSRLGELIVALQHERPVRMNVQGGAPSPTGHGNGQIDQVAADLQAQLKGNAGSTGAYEHLLRDVTKKVTQAVLQQQQQAGGADKRGGGVAGVAANPNVNYRALLEAFTQKMEARLEDAQEATAEELARMRKELLDLLRSRIDGYMRDLRGELMIHFPMDTSGDSTAVGTKPVMCVACSRPVPVSGIIRESAAGALAHGHHHHHHADETGQQEIAGLAARADLDFDRNDDEFVYRGGFKMPAERKTMTLPFLVNNIKSRVVTNPRRPGRGGTRVENVVREAMELDRNHHRYRERSSSPPKARR